MLYAMPSPTWKQLPTIEHPRGEARAARAPIGTAYHTLPTRKQRARGVERGHALYVKVRDDAWLCFQGASIDECLACYRATPGTGAPGSDYLIGDAISSVSAAGHVVEVRVTHLAPAAKHRPLSSKLAPAEIWRRLEERGATVVRRAVATKDLVAAEKALRFEFPPSYVELVKHGAPAIGRDLAFAVLVPKEVVKHTRELRRGLDPDMFEDPASLARVKAQLAKAVWFQRGRDDGEGYVYLLDTADRRGELRIADYHHDWLEELDWRPSSRAVFRSLSAATFHAAEQIAKHLPG